MRHDPMAFRKNFPAWEKGWMKGVYLDSAATSQMERSSWEELMELEGCRANAHRGVYPLSQRITERLEASRATAAKFIGAQKTSEIVFTNGTTSGINALAWALEESLPAGAVLAGRMEHHSNMLPWMRLAQKTRRSFGWLELNEDGSLDEARAQEKILKESPALVALSALSNVTGFAPNIPLIAKACKEAGSILVIDGAQAASRMDFKPREWGADFAVFSGHKVGGPMGVGILWGAWDRLKNLPASFSGGGMVSEVDEINGSFIPRSAPWRFEAGTLHVTGAIALARALEFWMRQDKAAIERHESALAGLLLNDCAAIDGAQLLGASGKSKGVASFAFEGAHAHDLGSLLGERGFSARVGHHCCKPLLRHFKQEACVRASVGPWNSEEEVRDFGAALRDALRTLRG